MMIRAFIAGVGLIGAIFGIVWVPIIAIVVLALRFRAWEALVLGVLVDFMWMPFESGFILPIFTLGAIFIVWALEPLRLEILRD